MQLLQLSLRLPESCNLSKKRISHNILYNQIRLHDRASERSQGQHGSRTRRKNYAKFHQARARYLPVAIDTGSASFTLRCGRLVGFADAVFFGLNLRNRASLRTDCAHYHFAGNELNIASSAPAVGCNTVCRSRPRPDAPRRSIQVSLSNITPLT